MSRAALALRFLMGGILLAVTFPLSTVLARAGLAAVPIALTVAFAGGCVAGSGRVRGHATAWGLSFVLMALVMIGAVARIQGEPLEVTARATQVIASWLGAQWMLGGFVLAWRRGADGRRRPGAVLGAFIGAALVAMAATLIVQAVTAPFWYVSVAVGTACGVIACGFLISLTQTGGSP